MISDKALKKFLMYAPANWVLVRIPECELLSRVKYKKPVLDVGCGDGYFAKVLLLERKEKNFDTGLDFSDEEISRAVKNKVYKQALVSDIKSMPFKNAKFNSAFSNGTLEHIVGIDKALAEVSRVMKPGGIFAFTVPSKHLGSYLFFSRLLNSLGLKNLATWYEDTFNSIFGHKNLFDHLEWKKRLAKSGFMLQEYTYYNSKTQTSIHDLLCWWAFPAFVCKKLFGRWIVVPQLRNVTAPVELKLLKRVGELSLSPKEGGSLFIVAKKK